MILADLPDLLRCSNSGISACLSEYRYSLNGSGVGQFRRCRTDKVFMTIPTEPIGSIPRPPRLIQAITASGDHADPALDALYEEAIRDTIERFEATGSPVITDGEQRKYHNFWTYCVQGMPNTASDGFQIPFSAGHVRRMPRLTAGPFRYMRHADSYLDVALRYAHVPVKQAVISPSALSLMYPTDELPGYAREQFI